MCKVIEKNKNKQSNNCNENSNVREFTDNGSKRNKNIKEDSSVVDNSSSIELELEGPVEKMLKEIQESRLNTLWYV